MERKERWRDTGYYGSLINNAVSTDCLHACATIGRRIKCSITAAAGVLCLFFTGSSL